MGKALKDTPGHLAARFSWHHMVSNDPVEEPLAEVFFFKSPINLKQQGPSTSTAQQYDSMMYTVY